jgi:hypothetical protein
MDDACEIMSNQISNLIARVPILGETSYRGEYAGTHPVALLDLGKLTQGELVRLYEFAIRLDEQQMVSRKLNAGLS